jgi:hypothetical protein
MVHIKTPLAFKLPSISVPDVALTQRETLALFKSHHAMPYVLRGGPSALELQPLPSCCVRRFATLLCCPPLFQFRTLLPNTLIVQALYIG